MGDLQDTPCNICGVQPTYWQPGSILYIPAADAISLKGPTGFDSETNGGVSMPSYENDAR